MTNAKEKMEEREKDAEKEPEKVVEEEMEEVVEEPEEGKKKKKTKKIVKKRKSKKEKESPLARAIRLTVESGKVVFGSRKGIKKSLLKGCKLFILARNTPAAIREDLLRYSSLSNIPVVTFEGTTLELGSICGKPFPVSILSVEEEGESNIMEFTKKKK